MAEKMTLREVLDGVLVHVDGIAPYAEVPIVDLQAWADSLTANLAQPAQAVDVGAIERSDVWVVQDEAGHPIHCAGWPQACREHIREAINEHGIEEARAWKVLHYTNGAPA